MSIFKRVSFDITAQDAFGRLKVANPETIFDSKQIHDAQPLIWEDVVLSGTGTSSTYNTNQASTTLAVSNTTAGSRIRQTYQAFPYQPGKGQDIKMTGILGNPATGITRRCGQFNTNNGVYWESSPTAKNVVIRSNTSGSPVNTVVAQSSWNLDKLDGTGASGVTVDFSKVLIFGIQYEWLGVGSVWFYVVVNGVQIFVHRFDTSNVGTLVYMSLPNLPLRWEITNGGTGGVASVTHICSMIASEGGVGQTGHTGFIARTAVLTTGNNSSLYPVIALRINSSYPGGIVDLREIYPICNTNSIVYNWYLLLNPTITGTALSWTSATNSVMQYDISRTNTTTVSGGTIIAGGTAITGATNSRTPVNDMVYSDLRMGFSNAGTADIIVLAMMTNVGGATDFWGGISWNESV